MAKRTNQRFTRQMAAEYREELQRYLLRRLSRRGLDTADIATGNVFTPTARAAHRVDPQASCVLVSRGSERDPGIRAQGARQPLHHAVDIVTTEDLLPAPDNSIDRVEHASSLTAALEGLPAMQRAALLLFKRDGKSYREIAQELNLSPHTVKKYLFLAAAHCRRQGWR